PITRDRVCDGDAVQAGQLVVDERDVGVMRPNLGQGGTPVLGLRDDLDLTAGDKGADDTLAVQRVVLGDQDPYLSPLRWAVHLCAFRSKSPPAPGTSMPAGRATRDPAVAGSPRPSGQESGGGEPPTTDPRSGPPYGAKRTAKSAGRAIPGTVDWRDSSSAATTEYGGTHSGGES